MNVTIFRPLVQEYVNGSAISETELDFLIQTGKDLAIDESTVKALIQLELEKQRPAAVEPASLLMPVVVALFSNGKVSEEDIALLKELAVSVKVNETVATALIAIQQAVVKHEVNSLIVNRLSDLLRGLTVNHHQVSHSTIEFVKARAKELKVHESVVEAIVEIQQLKEPSQEVAALFINRLLKVLDATELFDERIAEFVKSEAAVLGVEPDFVLLLLEVYLVAGEQVADQSLSLIDPLILHIVKQRIPTDTDRRLLSNLAERVKLPDEVLNTLIRFEVSLNARQPLIAEQLLNLVAKGLGGIEKLGPGAQAFIDTKREEVAKVDKDIKAQKQKESLAQGNQSASTPDVKAESGDIKVKSADSEPAPATVVVKKGMSETSLCEIDEIKRVAKKSGLYSHSDGFTFFIYLADKTTNTGSGLLILNGQEVDAAKVEELSFSGDGKNYAYKLKQPGGGECVVYNGVVGDPMGAVGGLTFSSDGKAFAYIARNGKTSHLVQNGVLGKPYAAIRDITFNPSNNQLAYVIYEAQKWHVLYSGSMEPGFQASGELRFSADGSQFIYWAKQGNQVFAMHNGHKGPSFEGVGEFTFGPGVGQIAYLVNRERKVGIFANGETSPVYDRVWWLSYSPDGKKLAYLANDGQTEFAVINGKAEKAYDKVSSFRFSAKGKNYAYEASLSGKKMVVRNGKPGLDFEQIARITFNPESEQLAYHAYRDKLWFVVSENEESEPFSDVDELVFSNDGIQFAFWARIKGEWTGIVNTGWRDGDFPNAKHLVFSDDSQQLAFVFFKKEGWHFVVNKEVINAIPYTEILQPPRYDVNKKAFYFLARRNSSVLLVTYV